MCADIPIYVLFLYASSYKPHTYTNDIYSTSIEQLSIYSTNCNYCETALHTTTIRDVSQAVFLSQWFQQNNNSEYFFNVYSGSGLQ